MIDLLEIGQILHDKGIAGGWEICGDVLTIWEHKEDPPAPLVRPVTPAGPEPEAEVAPDTP